MIYMLAYYFSGYCVFSVLLGMFVGSVRGQFQAEG